MTMMNTTGTMTAAAIHALEVDDWACTDAAEVEQNPATISLFGEQAVKKMNELAKLRNRDDQGTMGNYIMTRIDASTLTKKNPKKGQTMVIESKTKKK